MIRFIFSGFQYTVFAIIVLVLGQQLSWKGQSLSDYVNKEFATFQFHRSLKKLCHCFEEAWKDLPLNHSHSMSDSKQKQNP